MLGLRFREFVKGNFVLVWEFWALVYVMQWCFCFRLVVW